MELNKQRKRLEGNMSQIEINMNKQYLEGTDHSQDYGRSR